MQHLFSSQGQLALDAAMRLEPLLAFDFDGTLAPIVAHPDDARVPADVARQLGQLATQLPTAIVTGRSVGDVTPRLGFTPHYVVGNHGAEEIGGHVFIPPEAQLAMDGLRDHIAARRAWLDEAEVMLEDKRHSLALHYRLARSQARAVSTIQELLHELDPSLRCFGGKFVVNVVAAQAPDKADALFSLVLRSGAGSAVFVGDDVNDEAVFARALPHWLTVRVGRDDPNSRARFFLDDPAEMGPVLGKMLMALGGAR
ncbi:MAG: trehalose-phosphatase [Rubrivivax sp.]|nr:MAG: trehalose-phosphatase [Rubrivivax sp.]